MVLQCIFMKKTIDVSSLPKGGPYSHANVAGDMIFVSGQTGQVAGKDTTFTQQFENSVPFNIGKICFRSYSLFPFPG